MENKKMINYQYEKEAFSTFKNGIRREWALTNGIGGYAGSSLIGAHNRTHQGYLIASLHPPIERYLVFPRSMNLCPYLQQKALAVLTKNFIPLRTR